MPGVVFVNPESGDEPTPVDELAEIFAGHDVVECRPEELPDRVRKAIEEDVSFVGVAGGDGTIRSAADVLAGTDVPLLVVPAGTRNHFARELGIETIADAGRAAASGAVRRVDVGEVNGARFVNNSSIGIYPRIVVTREVDEHRLPKGVATLVATWRQLRHGHRFWVTFSGPGLRGPNAAAGPNAVAEQRIRAWMVFVGNGCYGRGLLRLMSREALDDHVLDVRIARADSPLARLRLMAALVFGGLERTPLLVRRTCDEVSLSPDRDEVEVSLDGEVERLRSPLHYRSVPGALAVLVPPG